MKPAPRPTATWRSRPHGWPVQTWLSFFILGMLAVALRAQPVTEL